MHSTGTWKVTGIIINWVCVVCSSDGGGGGRSSPVHPIRYSYETTTTTTRDFPTREFVPIVDRIINTRGLNR